VGDKNGMEQRTNDLGFENCLLVFCPKTLSAFLPTMFWAGVKGKEALREGERGSDL